MTNETIENGRRIVTCDGCGTPFVAVMERGTLLLVGPDSVDCPNCKGSTFSRLTI